MSLCQLVFVIKDQLAQTHAPVAFTSDFSEELAAAVFQDPSGSLLLDPEDGLAKFIEASVTLPVDTASSQNA
jgi:hypothetical protein